MSFKCWLISLSIISCRFIRVVHMRAFSSYVNLISSYTQYIFLSNGYSNYFYILSTVPNATVKMGVQLPSPDFTPFGYYIVLTFFYKTDCWDFFVMKHVWIYHLPNFFIYLKEDQEVGEMVKDERKRVRKKIQMCYAIVSTLMRNIIILHSKHGLIKT